MLKGSLRNDPARAAYRVLTTCYTFVDVPVKVADVSGRFDVELVVADLGPEISAIFIPKGNRGGITVLNKRHSRTRRRFSGAHELGHHLLDTTAERPANIFAANLLMPSIPFISSWLGLKKNRVSTVGRTLALAAAFWVSYAAAAVRVRELNLV